MVYGRCWSVVGDVSRVTGQASLPFLVAYKTLYDDGVHSPDAETDDETEGLDVDFRDWRTDRREHDA